MAGNANSGNRNAVYKGPFCGARNKAGNPCRAPAMLNGRCRVHGGATPSGTSSVHWRTGRYSMHLGPTLGPLVRAAMEDPDRHSMDQELALVDTRIGQLLAALEGKSSPSAWTSLADAMERFQTAQQAGKSGVASMHKALEEIQDLIRQGAGESAAWAEVIELIDRRRLLVESEEKRAITSGRAIPVDQVVNMLASFSRMVLDEVPDPAKRARIADRLRSIMHGRRIPTNDMPPALMESAV